jgi:hypothetical protein
VVVFASIACSSPTTGALSAVTLAPSCRPLYDSYARTYRLLPYE